MPKIETYTSQVMAQGARASGEDFGAQTAAAGMNLAGGMMDVAQAMHQQEVQQEVNDIQRDMLRARSEWTLQLENRANQAKPGDQTFVPRLKEDMRKYFEDKSQGVKTRKGQQAFSTLAAGVQADFLARGVAVQRQLAGEGAKINVLAMRNDAGNIVMRDPTQRDSVLGQNADYIHNLPGIDQVIKAQLMQGAEEYVNRMAVLGQIQRNPDELLARINPKDTEPGAPERQLKTGDPAFDALPADEQFKLVKQAREYRSAYEQDDNRVRMAAERERKEAQEGQMNSYLTRIIAPNPGDKPPTAREIMADTTLDSTHKQHLVDYMTRRERERSENAESRRNPSEVRRLLTDLYRGEDDPQKTYSMDATMEAYRKGQVSTAEMLMIRREVDNLRSPDKAPFQKEVGRFRSTVEKALLSDAVMRGLSRASADVIPAAMQRFNSDLDAKIEEYRKAGKNPRDLLTPGSRDYFLQDGRMQSYIDDATSVIGKGAARANSAAGGAGASLRQPGESPADYLKRTGK